MGNRSLEKHKRDALRFKNVATATRKEIEKETGARYSKLHRLPYYDRITIHTVYLIHNLYLGTAKHVFLKWINVGVIACENLSKIDGKMNNKKPPSGIG